MAVDEWVYDYACPKLHPATKKETADIISEKVEFPKVEEKIVFVQPRYKFEVQSGRGSDYVVSVCEEIRAGPELGGRGGGEKQNSGEKAAGAIKTEGAAEADGDEKGKKKIVGIERVHQWRDQVNNELQLEKSIDDGRGRGTVKKQRM
jgi:hypothetical protein